MPRQDALRKMPDPPAPKQNTALQTLVQNFSIELAPYADWVKALEFQREAAALTVTDRASHQEALLALKRGKALKRGIDDHWRKVLRWLEDRKNDIRTIMATDLELVDPGVERLNSQALRYETAERERERQEEERRRQEEETRARQAREKELAELDRQAQEAEATAEQLSDRERAFVQRVYAALGVDAASERWLNATAKACGFRQDHYGVTLMGREKIRDAVETLRKGAALRQQQAAVAEKPLDTRTVEVESHRATVAGTRTVVTHTGVILDPAACVAHLLAGGPDAPPADLFMVNQTKLNEYARAMRENIGRWRGVRYNRSETKAG